jgi:hypothetical protein
MFPFVIYKLSFFLLCDVTGGSHMPGEEEAFPFASDEIHAQSIPCY